MNQTEFDQRSQEIEIQINEKNNINGNLCIPKGAKAIVLFAHGSGSSRFSPRNRYVANVLDKAGLATLLIDLLTPTEEIVDLQTRQLRFDIELLTDRGIKSTDWLSKNSQTKNLKIGYFGASTGAAAALSAASQLGEKIVAIVSRGGRPDLATEMLPLVKAPTLLIVGGEDSLVIEMNKHAADKLCSEKKLLIVPAATHLFEEPGALEQVAKAAAEWFVSHIAM